jgi:pyrroline-5-carboxylate reductase
MFRGQVYRLGSHQTAAYTSAANAISNAFGAGTQVVRIVPTTAAYVKVGNSPTATTSDVYMKAGEAEYFVVTPGMRASAVRVTTNGVLHVTEVSG